MQGAKVVPFLRRITTFARQWIPPTAAPPLGLGSYLEENPSQVVYNHNRKIEGLIKAGNLISAYELFDGMALRDVVTYNILILGHGRNGCPRQAIELYVEMVSHDLRENASTFSSVLSICSDAGFCREGIQVHSRVISLGFGCNLFVGASLVDLYMSMQLHGVALKSFDEMPGRNVAVCNLLLRWFCEPGHSGRLFGVYRRMELEGVSTNGLTYCYMIRGCSNDGLLDGGKQLHSHVIKSGWAISNIFVANALVDFYSACGCLIDARKSFKGIPERDVISWNSIVSVCVEHECLLDSLDLFRRMQSWGKRPSVRSFVAFLNFCSRNCDSPFGKQTHCYILKMGFDVSSVHIQSALIDMYGKCSDVESSVLVYESMPVRTLECCNSLMTSLMHCGITEDVVEMFGLMMDEGTGIDEVSLSTVLKALSVSAPADLRSCTLIHGCAIKSGSACEIAVSCSLIDAYSRCGQFVQSRKVFEELASPNVFCFTSIINAYARNGMGRECINMLKVMDQKGLVPDDVTILCVLSGCNHSGLVEEGQLIFNSMESNYGIIPRKKHYSCMVDLLGRAGFLDKAEELLRRAPGEPDCVMWGSLLQSCRVHLNEVIGRRAAKMLMDLEPDDFAVYLQVSNFYSEIREFELSMQIREIAMSLKLVREIGCSSVEVKSFEQL